MNEDKDGLNDKKEILIKTSEKEDEQNEKNEILIEKIDNRKESQKFIAIKSPRTKK